MHTHTTTMMLSRSIVLVGLMGAGKTKVGRRLAKHLALPFVDTDHVIETESGRAIVDIFQHHGETEFRRLERQVMVRLMEQSPQVIASGGGLFIDPLNRDLIRHKAISVWLRVDLNILLRRTERCNKRPLLAAAKDDPPHRRTLFTNLIKQRYPIYAQADIIVDNNQETCKRIVYRILDALDYFLDSSDESSSDRSVG